MLDADFLRAGGFALVLVGAVAEALGVHLADHRQHALVALRLALRQVPEVGNLGGDEEHGTCIFARGHAGPAADAGSGIERGIRLVLGNGNGIGIHCRAGAHVDVATGSDDAVEGGAVHDQVADHRERIGAERLDPDGVAIAELAHVHLAGGDAALLAVRDAVDGERAGAADALAAVVIEVDRLLALDHEALIDDIEHFQKRGFLGNVLGLVGFDLALGLGPGLPPNFECEVHGKSRWKNGPAADGNSPRCVPPGG